MWRRLARAARERGPDAVADWLILAGGVALFLSLFLRWSHQISAAIRSAADGSGVLRGLPTDPIGWQVYSVADVLLAVLAVSLVALALVVGSVRVRFVLLLACVAAVLFVLHALSVPPTNGVLLINPASGNYVPRHATAGAGETVALAALGVAITGLGLSFVRR
jgi:hypothetical protein